MSAAEHHANRYQTTLTVGVDADDLTATVASTAAAPSGPFRAILAKKNAPNEDEIVRVTAAAAGSVTWERAVERVAGAHGSQTAFAHTAGTTLTQILTEVGVAQVAHSGARILAYDEFSRYADGPLNGKVPIVGPVWETTGTHPTQIVSGKAVAGNGGFSMGGYARMTLPEPATYLECIQVFSGVEDYGKTNGLVWSSSDLGNLIHFIFGAYDFDITLRKENGIFESFMGGSWRGPVRIDGVTPYRFGIAINGPVITVVGPHGDTYSHSDSRIPDLAAMPGVYWEPSSSATVKVQMIAVRALTRRVDQPSLDLAPSNLDRASHLQGDATAAAADSFWQVAIGKGPSGLASVAFGPAAIRTWLEEPVAIGATAIITRGPLLPGVTKIGSGNAGETVTVTGNPNPLPPSAHYTFTAQLTAPTTKAHAAYLPVVGPAPAQQHFTWNPYGGYFETSTHLVVAGFIKMSTILYDPNFLQLLTTRRQGWTAPTGAASRATFDPATVTPEEGFKRLKALIDDLMAHGLIGN